MQPPQTKTDRLTLEGLLLFWAILFGAFVRLMPVLGAGFPINDGGLFYTMTQDILRGEYALPLYTTYNGAGIPFAYPPLAFYLAAFLVKTFGLPLIEVIRFLPPLVAVATIPAFYLLSREVLKSRLRASLATVAFAMLPPSFDLIILGGGLTRSFGALFCLLTLWSVYRLYTRRERRDLITSALFAALLIWSHPESSFHTAFLAALFWLFWGRDAKSLLHSLAVAAAAIVLTIPWWLTVLLRHGTTPFLSILQSGWHNWFFWGPLLTFDFPNERYLSLIAVLGVIGLLTQLIRREFFLPAWLVTPFAVEPRNPYFFAIVPLAMLAAIGLDAVVLPGVRALERRLVEAPPEKDGAARYLTTSGGRVILAYFLLYSLLNAFAYAAPFARFVVTDEERQALQWVTENTRGGSRFLLITYGNQFNTPVQEWFPALTQRINLATVQGYEWLPDRVFYRRRSDFPLLMRCIFEDNRCVEDWAEQRGYEFEYVYIYQGIPATIYAQEEDVPLGNALARSLADAPDYSLEYQSEHILIFRHHRKGPNIP